MKIKKIDELNAALEILQNKERDLIHREIINHGLEKLYDELNDAYMNLCKEVISLRNIIKIAKSGADITNYVIPKESNILPGCWQRPDYEKWHILKYGEYK